MQNFGAQSVVVLDRFERVRVEGFAQLGDYPITAGHDVPNCEGSRAGQSSFKKPQDVFGVLTLHGNQVNLETRRQSLSFSDRDFASQAGATLCDGDGHGASIAPLHWESIAGNMQRGGPIVRR